MKLGVELTRETRDELAVRLRDGYAVALTASARVERALMFVGFGLMAVAFAYLYVNSNKEGGDNER